MNFVFKMKFGVENFNAYFLFPEVLYSTVFERKSVCWNSRRACTELRASPVCGWAGTDQVCEVRIV